MFLAGRIAARKFPSVQLRKCLPQLSSLARFSSEPAKTPNPKKKESLFTRWVGPNAGITKTDGNVNRWAMFVPAFVTHACLGAPYGWSAVSASLTREHGKLRHNLVRLINLVKIYQALSRALPWTGVWI